MYAIFLHAHQKIDRVAHRHLRQIVAPDVFFPPFKSIKYFEGQKGPDATKLKNKSYVEQPWHFVNPFDALDNDLERQIGDHYRRLVESLKKKDEVRAGFEAAWLAHALVDGLTPAHHYPYEQELERLRGEDRHTRLGRLGSLYVKGDTRRDSFMRSFQLIGPKGLLTTHTMFEGGVYTIMAPLRLHKAVPSRADLRDVRTYGVTGMFQRYAREIAALDLYVRFYKHGWTPKLTRDVRKELVPRMVIMVTLAWYSALCDAHMVAEPA